MVFGAFACSDLKAGFLDKHSVDLVPCLGSETDVQL